MNQNEKLEILNEMLERCKASKFYRERLPRAPLRSLSELKRIPVTTREDLQRHSPFGLICVPHSELFQYHESFGTTGDPTSAWFTRQDFKDNVKEATRWGVGFNEDDIVLVRFPYAISSIAHIVHAAAQSKRACVIPASSRSTVSPFPRIVSMMRKLGVTILACLPLQAVLIAETAELLGLQPDRDFPSLRAICTAGETMPRGKRKLIESLWGVPVFDNYGMTEIGSAVIDCEFGRPHALEDYFIFEVLGEDLKNDAKPGQTGYLVATTLRKRAMPLIRYLTGDRARIVKDECPCGSSTSLQIRGRREDTIAVGGKVMDLWDLDEIVSKFPCRRFWVVGPVIGGLHFVVEEEKPGDSVTPGLVSELESKYMMRFKVDVVPKGTLYDRSDLLSVGVVGKPRYIYSTLEMEERSYLKSARL